MAFRITTIHAWLSIDPDDGEEGVCGATTTDGVMMPLIAADETRVRQCDEMARKIARAAGITIRKVRFTTREDLTVIQPPSNGRD